MCARRSLASAALLLAVALATGCATLDDLAVAETHRLESAPWVVAMGGAPVPPGACAVVLPVTLDPELRHALGYGDRLARFAPLLAALDRRIAGRRGCVRKGGSAPDEGAPRVYVGSAESDFAPPEARAQRLPTDRFAPMVLHLARPSAAWREAARRAAAEADVPYVVQIQLGVSQYAKGRSGLFRKEVVLGSGHRRAIPFLSAEDEPVEVLHLTGVLLDADGRPRRAGAEGILLRHTPFPAGSAGELREEVVERDLPRERGAGELGAPLAVERRRQRGVVEQAREVQDPGLDAPRYFDTMRLVITEDAEWGCWTAAPPS